ncbi:uncharacterized protein HGUI_01986 [Hanseniaspora guilliermondii]|uniref:Uncharacterized protein n=1 Tax=Hanseniaspora guilliermondii TaxID=56406 RepID=A0A1L0B057_9ASCO|nr:uncharacterized protein HGUI_01986 [Hanseniaspora guilliermondii]
MFNIFFSIAISIFVILALVGCMRNSPVIKSLYFMDIDLSSISKDEVFPTIYSQISVIPSYIKIGLIGYCTPDGCVGTSDDFASFDIEKILIDAVISLNSSLESIVESTIDLVLPSSFSNYINTFNKIIDAFSILMAVWLALSLLTLLLKIAFFIFYRGFVWTIIYNFIRGLSCSVGLICAILATVGLYYGKSEFNKNEADDLGMKLLIGKTFIVFLWVAAALGFVDNFVSFITPNYLNRRVKTQPIHPIMV